MSDFSIVSFVTIVIYEVLFYVDAVIMIKTLAIETSCDDTSVGIVCYDQGHWSNPILKTYSQIQEHQSFGGVVPEVAYRLHEEKIIGLLEEIGYDEIQSCDCITVTKEPGLPGSLIVGNTIATLLGGMYNKPIYRVNHIYGHIVSLLLDRDESECPIPWVVLTVSGGHNELYYIFRDEIGKLIIERVGYSLDDAAGESFDKVSRMLGGSYPGGPWIEQMALLGQTSTDLSFKRILLNDKGISKNTDSIESNHLNFSFSGMKSQVYNYLIKHPLDTLSQQDIYDICLEFSECVSDILVTKLGWAAEQYQSATIGLVGGVSANDRLYDKLQTKLPHVHTLRPVKKVYSTDNAAMIGVVGIMTHQGLI